MEIKYTYIELLQNLESFKVGTKFKKFSHGVESNDKILVDIVSINDGMDSGLARVLTWDNGEPVIYNRTLKDMYFVMDFPYTEINICQAMEILRSGNGGTVYTHDCDGDMIPLKLDYDLSYDYDINSFNDLVNLTKFYVK